MSKKRFEITEEIRADGSKGYWVGTWSWSHDEDWWDAKHKFFPNLHDARQWIDSQIVVSSKVIYSV